MIASVLTSRRGVIAAAGVLASGAFMSAAAAATLLEDQMTNGSLKSWDDYVDMLKPAGDLLAKTLDPGNGQMKAELYRQFVMNITQSYFWYFQSTPEHPDWMPFENSVFLLQPNPDGVYYIAPVEGSGVYRIVGKRGTNPVIGLATGRGMFGTHEPKGSLNNYDVDGLTLGEDGSFEVILSGERPKDWNGDWRWLSPEAGNILLRQFSYDWGNEEEGRVAIERLDTPAVKQRLTEVEIGERLEAVLGGFVKRFSRICIDYQNKVLGNLGWNTMEVSGFEDLGNSPEWPQKYYRCMYDVKPDEALIIETPIPETCKYWNVQVNNWLWEQIDFGHRQSSLNAHQARLDADGKFRMVVALNDPGVPNWLDTDGYQRGMLVGRWHGASDYPLPTMTKVKLADIRQHLPTDTPHVSPEEREKVLRHRNLGLQMRRRW